MRPHKTHKEDSCFSYLLLFCTVFLLESWVQYVGYANTFLQPQGHSITLKKKKLFSFASSFATKSAYKRFYFQKSFYLVPRLYRTHFFTLAKTLTSCYGLFFAMYRQWMGKSLPFGYFLAMFISWLGQMLRYNIAWWNSSANFFPSLQEKLLP